jgi:hypothetical protein
MTVELVIPTQPSDEQRFVVTIEDSDADARTVELHIAQPARGEAVCTAITVRKQTGVVSRDIRIPLERYLDLVGRHPARVISGDRRRRRVLTDDFLRTVADAYRSGGGIAGMSPTVDARFHASDSQKYRWIKAARERGLLDPRGDH